MGHARAAKAHLEIEVSFVVTESEYSRLKAHLPTIGFLFDERLLITDFLIPTVYARTNRVRIARIIESANGSTGVRCWRGFKSHPMSGPGSEHIRKELEPAIKFRQAKALVCGAAKILGAPVPYYSKERCHFVGSHGGFAITMSLDQSVGLEDYSGYALEIETQVEVDSQCVVSALAAVNELAQKLLGAQPVAKISYRRMRMRTWNPSTNKSAKKLSRRYRRLLKKVRKARTLKKLERLGAHAQNGRVMP